jgi:signal transduction histidine kinase
VISHGGPSSLRLRLTLLATSLLAVGLAAGALLLFTTLSVALRSSLDGAAEQSAKEVAALVDAGRLSDPLPVGGPPVSVVQVIDNQGRVLAASAGADRLVPVLDLDELARARAGERLSVAGERAAVDGPLRVLAEPTRSGPTVVVAVGQAGALKSERVVRTGLLVGIPVLLVVGGALTWAVVGWTLRPVEALRRGAEVVAATGGTARLPVPAADDEVRRLAVTLNGMLARLAAVRARQRAFVADAAHELRSPLASLRAQLEVARRLGPESGSFEGFVDDLLADTDRLSQLADDLLLLARLDEVGSPADGGRVAGGGGVTVDVRLDELAEQVVGRHQAAPVRVVADTEPATVRGSGPSLDRALTNVVDNAVRYAASTVTVEVRNVDGTVRLLVRDDGPGVAAADRARVLERFARLDDSREAGRAGAGLGLAIVREVMRAHGGSVVLDDSSPGAAEPGLMVILTLPSAAIRT